MDLTPHPTIPGLYLTRDGKVFAELTISHHGYGGYSYVRLVGGQMIRIHTLMAETFVGPRPLGQGVRHLDGNPVNNSPENLAWGTQAENMQDKIMHGTSLRGNANHNTKLTEEQAREIKRRRKAGESGRSLAKEFNISEQTVALINTGKQWGWL